MPKEIINKQQSLFRKPFIIFKEEKGQNILFIGGSSTYGVYNDDFHSFPYLLEKKVNGISCLNTGHSGYISDDYIKVLKKCCKEYCIPNLVVFYTGFNDLFYKNFRLEADSPFKWWGKLERFSFLFLTIRQKLIINEQVKLRRDFNYRKKYVEELVRNIEECIRFANAKNIKVVIIPEVVVAEKFSSSPTRDYRWYKEVYAEVPNALGNLALKYGCYFLDPTSILHSDWKNNFCDPVHFTDKGNEIMSIFLAHNLSFKNND